MLDACAAGNGERRSSSLPHPRAKDIAAQRSAKHLTDQRQIALSREDSRKTFPALRTVDNDCRLAESSKVVYEISNDAGLVCWNSNRCTECVSAHDVRTARQRADAIAAVDPLVDRRQPMARRQRAPRAVRG